MKIPLSLFKLCATTPEKKLQWFYSLFVSFSYPFIILLAFFFLRSLLSHSSFNYFFYTLCRGFPQMTLWSNTFLVLMVLSQGSAMKRERCDSLPSRNRAISESSQQNNTSMPPPRSIPSNRPHSMYNRHSNSPPVNSCPLSPSGACSESDGSSLSIDETDGFGQSLTPDEYGHHFQRYMGWVSFFPSFKNFLFKRKTLKANRWRW